MQKLFLKHLHIFFIAFEKKMFSVFLFFSDSFILILPKSPDPIGRLSGWKNTAKQ